MERGTILRDGPSDWVSVGSAPWRPLDSSAIDSIGMPIASRCIIWLLLE